MFTVTFNEQSTFMLHTFLKMLANKFLSPNIGWRLYNRRTFVINQVKKYFSHGTSGSETISSSIWKVPYQIKSNDDGEEEKEEKLKCNLKSSGRLQWKFSNAIWNHFTSFEVDSLETLSSADCEILCDHILISSSIPHESLLT